MNSNLKVLPFDFPDAPEREGGREVSNETPVERFIAWTSRVPAIECVSAKDYDKLRAENERLTEVAEQHEVELAFWKPGLAAWRLVTAPTDENLYRLACEADARLDGMAGEEGWRHILAALDRVVRAAQSREAQRPDPTS